MGEFGSTQREVTIHRMCSSKTDLSDNTFRVNMNLLAHYYNRVNASHNQRCCVFNSASLFIF